MIELIVKAFEWIREKIRQVVKSIFNFALDCVAWFQGIRLRNSDVVFVADANKFADMLGQAPVRDCGIFEGVFDQQTGEITVQRYVASDDVDDETRKTMGGEDLIILE